MKYKYIGEGPFPLEVYGVGVVHAKDDVIETDAPINHKHFVELRDKKEKPSVSEGAE